MSTDALAAPGVLMTTEELARLVKVDPSTVRRWRTADPVQGPAFIRLSARVVKYDPEDVRAWLGRHRTDPEESAQ